MKEKVEGRFRTRAQLDMMAVMLGGEGFVPVHVWIQDKAGSTTDPNCHTAVQDPAAKIRGSGWCIRCGAASVSVGVVFVFWVLCSRS